jgi:hypothetical protein
MSGTKNNRHIITNIITASNNIPLKLESWLFCLYQWALYLHNFRQLVKLQEDARRQVYENSKPLNQLLQNERHSADDGATTTDLFKLPVESIADMEDLEQWIKTLANFTALVSFPFIYYFIFEIYNIPQFILS